MQLLSNRSMRAAAKQYLEEIRVNIPSIDAPVEKLSGGQRQAIVVARATRQPNVKVLLLDEPLSAMGAKEAFLIINLIRDISQTRGVPTIVIDHNYTHIFEVCSRVNVLQRGVVTFDKRIDETSIGELTEFMISSYRREVEEGSHQTPTTEATQARRLPAALSATGRRSGSSRLPVFCVREREASTGMVPVGSMAWTIWWRRDGGQSRLATGGWPGCSSMQCVRPGCTAGRDAVLVGRCAAMSNSSPLRRRRSAPATGPA